VSLQCLCQDHQQKIEMNKSKSIASPIQIDGSGWKRVLMRVKERIVEDNIPIVAAGVAFYAFLAIFPGIMALAFTLGTIIVIIVSLVFIVLFPVLVNTIGLPGTVESLITWLRWPLLGIIIILAISLIYRYGPARKTPGFQWVIFGATVATIVWLIASWGFSVYVSNFGNFGEIYGSLSVVVIMLFWLFITSFIILVGGELNRAIESYAENRLTIPEQLFVTRY